jgi:hypothetical protein
MRLFATLLVVAAALALPVAAVAGATHTQFNVKFTFTGQTFTENGTVVTTTGVIYAGSKTTGGGSTFTNCDYYTAQGASLGNFQSADFASNDAGLVLNFCLLHFADKS